METIYFQEGTRHSFLPGIISLSSGIIGEDFVKHEVDLVSNVSRTSDSIYLYLTFAKKGLDFIKRSILKLVQRIWFMPFLMIASMILYCRGGNIATLPLWKWPTTKGYQTKIFSFSDTTMNHLIFIAMGQKTFYGQSFLADICELD